VIYHALDVVEKELSAGVEVAAALETRPRPLTELPNPDIQLGALAEALCGSNHGPGAFERR